MTLVEIIPVLVEDHVALVGIRQIKIPPWVLGQLIAPGDQVGLGHGGVVNVIIGAWRGLQIAFDELVRGIHHIKNGPVIAGQGAVGDVEAPNGSRSGEDPGRGFLIFEDRSIGAAYSTDHIDAAVLVGGDPRVNVGSGVGKDHGGGLIRGGVDLQDLIVAAIRHENVTGLIGPNPEGSVQGARGGEGRQGSSVQVHAGDPAVVRIGHVKDRAGRGKAKRIIELARKRPGASEGGHGQAAGGVGGPKGCGGIDLAEEAAGQDQEKEGKGKGSFHSEHFPMGSCSPQGWSSVS